MTIGNTFDATTINLTEPICPTCHVRHLHLTEQGAQNLLQMGITPEIIAEIRAESTDLAHTDVPAHPRKVTPGLEAILKHLGVPDSDLAAILEEEDRFIEQAIIAGTSIGHGAWVPRSAPIDGPEDGQAGKDALAKAARQAARREYIRAWKERHPGANKVYQKRKRDKQHGPQAQDPQSDCSVVGQE